jgi:acetyl-CoA carboxylase, biotin carboxylase subunit
VLIKAVGGGGGRGMKQVQQRSQMSEALELAMAEANTAFGDARVYLERFVASGRHVEVQLLGDGERIIHLGTRDCSIQRRYQKLVEEAPAPGLSNELRDAIHEAAVTFGRHLHYRGAGTVEFLVDRGREAFYFLEMNARIQVEHPVTESVTGLDLVAEQIAVAQGQPLRLSQEDVAIKGHAIECRINAEDSSRDFRPSPGIITTAVFPAGIDVRVDTHIETGSRVPPFYDSLLAKIIVSGTDRPAALKAMESALMNCRIEGVHTNLALHAALMADPIFCAGGVDTSFLPDFLGRVANGWSEHGHGA